MREILDLDKYPLDDLTSPTGQSLVEQCQADLLANGMFNLPGFLRMEAVKAAIAHARPQLDTNAFVHKRGHNIYFESSVPGLEDDHPALRKFETINHTIARIRYRVTCLSMFMNGSLSVYFWPPSWIRQRSIPCPTSWPA